MPEQDDSFLLSLTGDLRSSEPHQLRLKMPLNLLSGNIRGLYKSLVSACSTKEPAFCVYRRGQHADDVVFAFGPLTDEVRNVSDLEFCVGVHARERHNAISFEKVPDFLKDPSLEALCGRLVRECMAREGRPYFTSTPVDVLEKGTNLLVKMPSKDTKFGDAFKTKNKERLAGLNQPPAQPELPLVPVVVREEPVRAGSSAVPGTGPKTVVMQVLAASVMSNECEEFVAWVAQECRSSGVDKQALILRTLRIIDREYSA